MDVDDFKTRVLVLEYVYGFLEDLGVERSGDDCGFDSFAGEKLSHVKSWYHVAMSHVREEEDMELRGGGYTRSSHDLAAEKTRNGFCKSQVETSQFLCFFFFS